MSVDINGLLLLSISDSRTSRFFVQSPNLRDLHFHPAMRCKCESEEGGKSVRLRVYKQASRCSSFALFFTPVSQSFTPVVLSSTHLLFAVIHSFSKLLANPTFYGYYLF